jgi:hypothetical protein
MWGESRRGKLMPQNGMLDYHESFQSPIYDQLTLT